MHECLLCKRDMKVSNDVFGNGCVRNIYSFLDLQMPRKVNLREETLYKNIMKINNVNSLNNNQKIWLTDRYLTYQYLNRIPYGNYNTIKKQINYDIQNIKQIKKDEQPKSAKNMSLKQAYALYKKVMKFQDGIDKISKGNFTDEDSIKTIITSISFIFNMSKNKKQYEKNAFKGMQFAFWQTVIEVGGKYAEFPISAEFLQHSLDGNPEDLYITDGNIVETIKNDNNFQNIIKKIVDEKGKDKDSFEFNSKDYVNHEYDWAFNDKDLYFALHLVELKVSALKENDKWNLDIKIHDTYDYSKAKNLFQYYNDTNSIPKSILSSSLYNLAAFSNYFKVMKIYDIDIEFTINDYQ